MLKIALLCLSLVAATLSTAAGAAMNDRPASAPLSLSTGTGDTYMGIRLLGSLRLPPVSVAGQTLGSLSGLAWDEDDNVLYAVSDRGVLFHLRPVLAQERLTDVQFLAAYPLQDAKGRPLKAPWGDAEGLTLDRGANGVAGDGELIISFERRPRLVRYSPKGNLLGLERLPANLSKADRYADSNKALEAVTRHPRWGLLTASERPLQGERDGYLPITAASGRVWSYPLHSAPQSSLVAMEALPDGDLLTLERAFVSVLHPLVIALRRTGLPAAGEDPLKVDNVAVFDTSQGWLMDNFEGLTRQQGRRFFMISDDNGSPLQRTLLVYFELLETKKGVLQKN